MGYQTKSGRWADTLPIVLAVATAVSSSSEGTPVEVGDRGVARLDLTVSAIGSGTTFTATVKTCDTETGTFRTVAAFTAATATGAERKSFAGLDRWVRVDGACSSGTTTATFSVSGEAV
jgi:hypothetical protein